MPGGGLCSPEVASFAERPLLVCINCKIVVGELCEEPVVAHSISFCCKKTARGDYWSIESTLLQKAKHLCSQCTEDVKN